MARDDPDLLQQEVEELTVMLRSEELFADLRCLLAERDLDPQTLLMAGLLEGKEGREGGVVVTPDGCVLMYERDALDPLSGFSDLRTVENPSDLLRLHPAVIVALSFV